MFDVTGNVAPTLIPSFELLYIANKKLRKECKSDVSLNTHDGIKRRILEEVYANRFAFDLSFKDENIDAL